MDWKKGQNCGFFLLLFQSVDCQCWLFRPPFAGGGVRSRQCHTRDHDRQQPLAAGVRHAANEH